MSPPVLSPPVTKPVENELLIEEPSVDIPANPPAPVEPITLPAE